ncbi:MAG TPA: hypothetical protein VL201_04060 [Patescibacteria group bacterium]|nr:hypothetical protein [Patescibacteria group bacterium]
MQGNLKRFVLCPQDDAQQSPINNNIIKSSSAESSSIFEVKEACSYTCLFLFILYYLFF